MWRAEYRGACGIAVTLAFNLILSRCCKCRDVKINLVMQSVVGMELAELRTALSSEPAFRAQQIYDAVYRRRVTDFDRIFTLPKALRERIAHELPIVLPEIERRYD